jgi:hypothetical protein
MTSTLQTIFQTSFSSYASKHRLPLKYHQAARAIMTCRTPAQGGHEQYCPDGHESRIQYHSCRHRSCPLCNALPKEQWAQKQFHKLLATDHYHVIFTLPHELLPLWRYNRHWFTNTLFHTVSDTLTTLAKDPKHLGALPGMILSLHTWGRNLILHPHIHCLITGGGLSPNGEWKGLKKDYLFPSRVVRALYQGKVLSALWQAVREGEIAIPPSLTRSEVERSLKQIARKKWNVRIQPPYAHGKGVMKYLSRYVKGGPISNHRINQADSHSVEFSYRDHHDDAQKTQQLSTDNFIERILDHVAEPGQHVIRHYGLYGHQARDKRNVCRSQLGQPPEQDIEKMTWDDFISKHSTNQAGCCRECGKRLQRGAMISKNSIYRQRWSGYVQQAVRTDALSCVLTRFKPPDRPDIFFGGSAPIN